MSAHSFFRQALEKAGKRAPLTVVDIPPESVPAPPVEGHKDLRAGFGALARDSPRAVRGAAAALGRDGQNKGRGGCAAFLRGADTVDGSDDPAGVGGVAFLDGLLQGGVCSQHA